VNVLFLARDGISARYIAGELSQQGLIDAVLFESGRPARLRKLRRHFAGSPLSWPDRIKDLFALRTLSRDLEIYLTKHLSVRSITVPTHRCDDANDARATKILKRDGPDLVVVYGTAILRPETLNLAPLFLNIHSGLVPKYRNVHSEFWALATGHPEEIGTSILHVTPGIDAGPIALQKAISVTPQSLAEGHYLNLKLGATLAAKAIQLWRAGALPSMQQESSVKGYFKTPGWRDIELHVRLMSSQ